MVHHNSKSRAWLFFKNNIISIIIFTTIIVSTMYYTAGRLYDEITSMLKQETLYTLQEIKERGYKPDMETICLITNCIVVKDPINNKIVFVRSNITQSGLLKEIKPVTTNNGIIIDSYNLSTMQPFVKYQNLDIYSLTTIKLEELKDQHLANIIFYASIWFLGGMVTIVLIRMYIRKYQGVRDREEMEEKLRKRLTESVHHELSGPLSTIKANLKAGYAIMFPCKEYGGSCQMHNGTFMPGCANCSTYSKFNNVEEGSISWNYLNALAAIDQMQSVLNIMANAKHIQYTNGSVSLAKILDTLVASKRLTTYNLVKIDVINKEGLEKFSCGNGLKNGELSNILTSMVNNSIEAEANHITISWCEGKQGYIDIFIRDNGYGVRDRKNRLIKDVANFKIKYGYSTKISPYDLGDMVKKNKIFQLLTNIIGSDLDYIKVRGSGLHINRSIIEMYGGSIELFKNSEDGATFKVVVPVKEVHFDELEKEVIKKI